MSPEEMEAAMRALPFLLIVGLVLLVAGIWMVIDAWGNYGAGWGCLSCIGCLFFSWIAIVVYLIIRFAVAPPSRTVRTSYVSPAGGTPVDYAPLPPVDITLTPEERDARLDEMIERGEYRAALDQAQQMLQMARDFKDTSGQRRYAKYVERIERRMR